MYNASQAELLCGRNKSFMVCEGLHICFSPGRVFCFVDSVIFFIITKIWFSVSHGWVGLGWSRLEPVPADGSSTGLRRAFDGGGAGEVPGGGGASCLIEFFCKDTNFFRDGGCLFCFMGSLALSCGAMGSVAFFIFSFSNSIPQLRPYATRGGLAVLS